LERRDRYPATEPGDGLGLRGDPSRHIGEADVADLACRHEVVKRPERFLDRGAAVPVVQPVDVDVVSLQSPQRVLELGDERLAAAPAAIGVAGMQVGEELRAEHDAFAQTRPVGKEVTNDLLGVPVGVDVGGVHDVAASVEVLGQEFRGALRAGAPAPVLAEGHRAEGERADAQTRRPSVM
jgi:hypothetical protein